MLNLDKLLDKEISRREFVGLVGTGILSIIGIASLLKNMNLSIDKYTNNNNNVAQYGETIYGGGNVNQP
jgi:hypothetical protein